jgi:hypothetical protein
MNVPEFLAPQLVEVPPSETESLSKDEPFGGRQTGESVESRLPHTFLAGFSIPRQERTNWCWAAVTVGIAQFGLPNTVQTQCELATSTMRYLKVINQTSSCGCINDGCDRAVTLSVPLNITGIYRTMHSKAAKFEDIVNEISGRRPVACHIDWRIPRHPGHFVAVGGARKHPEEGRRIYVFDPDGTTDEPTYEDFINRYTEAGGKWDYTYLIDYRGSRTDQQPHLASPSGGLLSKIRGALAQFRGTDALIQFTRTQTRE